MKIRHTVVFTFHDSTTTEQREELIKRLNGMGLYLQKELGVTDWTVAKHIPETFKERRAHLLQDGIFPNLETLQQHGSLEVHKRVIELAPAICSWMVVDTAISEG